MLNLQDRYRHFNNTLFGGNLPLIKVGYAPLSGKVGQFKGGLIKSKRPEDADWEVSQQENTAEIMIDNSFMKTDREVEAILAHEMIHAYFYFNGQFNENHGPGFDKMRRQLSKKLGFEIEVTCGVTPAMRKTKHVVRVGVIGMTKKDGEVMFAIVSADRLHREHKEIEALAQRLVSSGYATSFAAYEIETLAWTRVVAEVPVQRVPLEKLAYFTADKQHTEIFDDLKQNGHVIWRYSA